MSPKLRLWIFLLIGLSLIGAAVVFEKCCNGPIGGGIREPPWVVVEDVHGLQLDLVVLEGYRPSRRSGGFTCIGLEGRRPLCTLPFNGYTVVLFLLGALTLLLNLGYNLLPKPRDKPG